MYSLATVNRAVLMASAIFAASISLSGCGSQPGMPVDYWVAVNASASNSQQLGMSIHLASTLPRLVNVQDRLTVYRIDAACLRVYNGAIPKNIAEFQYHLIDALQALTKETGTHSGQFLKAACGDLPSGRPITVIYLTDGFEEESSPAQLADLRRYGALIAHAPNVRDVFVLGVNDTQAPLWKSVFPGMGRRFHFQGPLDGSSIKFIEAAADARR